MTTVAGVEATGDRQVLVVGLGNPVDEYDGTRHNVGADTVRLLSGRHHRGLERNKRIRAEVAMVTTGDGTRMVLVVPMGYMNNSGGPTQAATRWFDVELADVIVVHDDIDLPVGQLRAKLGGGHAGHNGLRDIDRALGARDYLRVRIGVGRPPGRLAARHHVLRRPSAHDREVLAVMLEHAADAVESLAVHGLETTQNRFNALDVTTS